MVSSVFGMTVVLGPVIGPALGGILAETYNWRWAFYMIVPAGILATVALRFTLPADGTGTHTRLDWLGFLALATTIACVQLVFSRGQRLDWYESTEIIVETGIAALAFWVFLAHSLTARAPFLNLRLLLNRNYALGLVLVTLYGMVNFTPIVLLPSLLQAYAGYPDSIIGLIVGYRGIGATIGFACTLVIGRLDPRIGLVLGYGLLAVAGIWLTQIDLNVDVDTLLLNAALQGLAVGIIWVPLTVMTFATLESRHLAEAMALFHLLRNIGSSLFISLCVTEIVRATTANYSRMTELITPYNKVLGVPNLMGGWSTETVTDLAKLSREINRQASMLGYINAFGLFTAACVIAMLFSLLARRGQRSA
jgi:DHA2 family multidrug resistance protein